MSNLFQKLRGPFGIGLLISAMLHLSIAALLLVNWDLEEQKPEPEETVSVEIVPPPEEEEEQPAEEQEQPAAEKEPVEKEQEEPPPAEELAQEEPPASDEPPPEAETTPPPPPASSEELATAQQSPIQPFRPVFEFGEKAQEAEGTPEGNSAQAEPDEEQPPGLAEDEAGLPEEATPSPDDPQAFPDPNLSPFVEEPTEEKTPETVEDVEEEEIEEPDLAPARTLYSEESGRARNAVAAMAGLPRGVRGGQLCTTELREQLRHSRPAYDPDILPAYRFPEGNVMTVRKGAFRAEGRWYNIAFNCEINTDGTRILGFSHNVGTEIPRNQWAERNLPEF